MRVIEESFELNRSVADISETDISIATGEGMQDIWKYKVPVGYSLVFSNDHVFAAYLESTAPAECAAGTLVAVEKRDANQRSRVALLDTLRYAQLKDLQDADKLVHLDIEPGKTVVVGEGEYVVITGNTLTVTLDASDSYFRLTCKRLRKTML